MLDDTAAEMLPTVFDLDATLKAKNIMNDVKPWLAFSSNVPQNKRDSWSKMVKVDALSELPVSCKASNTYYSWEKPGQAPVFGGERLLQELIRSAAMNSEIDEMKVTKLVNMVNSVTDAEGAAAIIQKNYREQLIKDISPIVKKDANFNAERFPNLAKAVNN